MLYAGFKRLHELGFRMQTVMSLRGKHIEALASDWHARGFSASTLHNDLSIFRTFAEWIGKAGMVRGIEHYLGPRTPARSSIAREDMSWSGRGVDVAAKIEAVRLKDARVAFGCGAALGLASGTRVYAVGDQLACLVALLACPLQRHVGVCAEGQPLFYPCHPVSESPKTAARRGHE